MEYIELKNGWQAYFFAVAGIVVSFLCGYLLLSFTLPHMIAAIVDVSFLYTLLFLGLSLFLLAFGVGFPYFICLMLSDSYIFTETQLIRENKIFSSRNYVHDWDKSDKIWLKYESGKNGGYYLRIKTADQETPLELWEGFYSNLPEAADFAMECTANCENGTYKEQRKEIFKREIKDVKKWIGFFVALAVSLLMLFFKYFV